MELSLCSLHGCIAAHVQYSTYKHEYTVQIILVIKPINMWSGSRDRIQIFLQKCIILGLNKSLWLTLAFAIFQAVKVKTYGRNSMYWVLCQISWRPSFLPHWLIGWTIDSYWFIVLALILSSYFVKAYSRTAEKRKHSCAELKYVLPVHWNLMESWQGHSVTTLESVIQWF